MLSYIANIDTAKIIRKICKRKNILILNSKEESIDLLQYMKATKVNFNLIKYLIIDLSLIINSDSEIIESIYNFTKIYTKTRIIILALDYNEQNIVLTNFYDLCIYNIINESEKIEERLNMALSENGIQKNEAKKFKKNEEVIQKESKIRNLINWIKTLKIKASNKQKSELKKDVPNSSVYLFSLILEAVTRLVKLICYLLIFALTSVGLTILLNSELRELVFQMFGLK